MVYYRKYRPQTIAELDSTKVRETLYSALRGVDEDDQNSPRLSAASPGKRAQPSASVPHAFLLTGPKGLGKTSTARIIAKVVNCENRKKGSIEPCSRCDSCVSITNGTNIDVLEIDGASNRGIDEIRDLRDKVKLAPSRAKKKVYIIDEVHMLTTEAFNALLKTIEEPPAHVMFLFATTEPHKVPDTILSRCFHVAFPKATTEDIVHSLERVAKGEKLDIENGVLEEIAKLADGGFRDAAKILEEMVMMSHEEKITKDLIEKTYSVSSISSIVASMFEALQKQDSKACFGVIEALNTKGIDSKYFISQFLDLLHELLLVKVGVIQDVKYQIQHTSLSLTDIQELANLFSQAYQDTKYAVIPQLPLELAVVAWLRLSAPEGAVDGGQNSADVVFDDKENVIPAKVGIQEEGSPIKSGMTTSKHTMDSLLKKEKTLKVQAVLRGDKEAKPVAVKKNTDNNSQEKLSDKEAAERLMDNLIFKVKPYNHSVAGVLRGCKITSMSNEKVFFATAYTFHKEKLDEIKTKQVLEQALKEITGKNLKVMIELTK